MENTSPTAFLGVSLLVAAVSVFPQICQAGLAEKNYLSSSYVKAPVAVLSLSMLPQQPHAGCLVVLVPWTINQGPGKPCLACVTMRCQEPAGGSSKCLERKEVRGKQRVLGHVPTQSKGEAWGRGHIRKRRVKWV